MTLWLCNVSFQVLMKMTLAWTWITSL